MVLWDEYDPDCPQFDSSVTKVPLPAGFKFPRIEPYDGTSDPHDHLRKFYVHMMVYCHQSTQQFRHATNAIFCRVFPSTLTGTALRWFFTFTPRSVGSFVYLTEEFLKRFESCKTTTSLSLKQRDDECLKDYVARCKRKANKADDICSRDFLRLVMAGLKSGSFKESVVEKPPLKLKDLWKRATLFVDEDDNKQPCTKRQRVSSSDGDMNSEG